MALFDDPKKELQRLQQQLLAEEDEDLDELMEEFQDDDYEELFEDDYEEEYEQENYLRHFSGGYGKNLGKREKSIFDEIEDAFEEDYEDDEEPFAVYVEEKRNIFGKRKVISGKKPGMSRGFKIMILLEIIAILCVAIWWVVMQL